jgi:hypothetical protein
MMPPDRPKPVSIIAQLTGSGTPETGAGGDRIESDRLALALLIAPPL